MWKLISLALLQSGLLAAGQLFLKMALERMQPFGWNREFWVSALLNWQFALSGVLVGSATLLWMYLLRNFPLSVAYSLGSVSYVITIMFSMFILHEEIPVARWIGVAMIMAGVCLVSYK